MTKYCVAIVSGTRPDIVKLAPVYHALVAQRQLEVHWIHTGQHADMARDMLRCFGIVSHSRHTRTGTTLAVHGGVPVLHMAGTASLHFAPTQRAKAALLAEGVPAARIVLAGSTVVDAQKWVCARYGIAREPAQAGHILVSARRRTHWDGELEQTFQAVADVAAAHPGRRVLFPLHLNPLIGRPAQSILGRAPNVSLLPPLEYLATQNALVNADLLLTDSGCLQEEASTFGVPTIVLRPEAACPEVVEAGCVFPVDLQRDDIAAVATRLLRDRGAGHAMRKAGNPFGDGRAAERISTAIRILFLAAAAAAAPLSEAADRIHASARRVGAVPTAVVPARLTAQVPRREHVQGDGRAQQRARLPLVGRAQAVVRLLPGQRPPRRRI